MLIVVLWCCAGKMRVTIHLDSKLRLRRVKIQDVGINTVLAAKSDPKLFASEVSPQPLFRLAGVATQGFAFLAFTAAVEVQGQNKPPPDPLLGKEGEQTQEPQLLQNTSP